MKPSASNGSGRSRGILELELLARQLERQRDFYGRTLHLPVMAEAADRITIQAGGTRLTFLQAGPEHGHPIYHFAFNIPENQLAAAKEWLGRRVPPVPLLTKEGREVFHFETWNAHSIYFHDPAGNIVEFIARHNLRNAASGRFSEEKVLHASEIGLVVDDVAAEVASLGDHLGLPVYRPGSPTLVPVGDEHRLLIVVQRDHVWLPTRDTRARAHPTSAILAGSRSASYKVAGQPYTVLMR